MKPYELLTPKQVAALFAVSVRTIERRVVSGDFPPPALILGMKRWRKEDVEAYAERQFKLASGEAKVK